MSTQPILPARYQLGESVMVTMTVKAIRFTDDGTFYDLIAEQGSGKFAATYNANEPMLHPITDAEHTAELERQLVELRQMIAERDAEGAK